MLKNIFMLICEVISLRATRVQEVTVLNFIIPLETALGHYGNFGRVIAYFLYPNPPTLNRRNQTRHETTD